MKKQVVIRLCAWCAEAGRDSYMGFRVEDVADETPDLVIESHGQCADCFAAMEAEYEAQPDVMAEVLDSIYPPEGA